MIPGQRSSSLPGVLLLAVVAGFAPGCTLFDEVSSGTPFTPDQPKAEVTVVGRINIDSITASQEGCSSGSALLWGIARNTGDLDVADVYIEIDALGVGGGVLDTYRTHVFNGEVIEITPPEPTTPEPPPEPPPETAPSIPVAGTSLTVDQSGSFSVCTRLAAGSVAGTAYRTDFTVIYEIE